MYVGDDVLDVEDSKDTGRWEEDEEGLGIGIMFGSFQMLWIVLCSQE